MKLQAALAPLALPLDNTVPLLATLLSIPLSDADTPLDLTPQQQRQQTLTAILGIVLALAEQQPVLMIVEDLHWVDPSTLELLDLLIDQAPTLRLFVVLTCRPTFRHPWGLRTHLTPLMLNRLARDQVAQMVARVAGGKRLPSEVVHHIVTQTDGVPLFIEELTKAILESGLLRETDGHYELTGPLSAVAIPTTLQDSLMARLDRLGTAKGIAQWGATLGRQFSYALLQAVSQREEVTLQRELGRLVEAELLYQRGVVPQATYLFKHALIQEAAYQSLLRSTRQYYHQRAARVLTEQFPETAETHPELIAHHYTEAACNEQAVPYWQRAGQRAIERSAHVEAVAHLTQGTGRAHDPPGDAGTRSARTGLASCPWDVVECHQRLAGTRSGTGLQPGSVPVSAGRRERHSCFLCSGAYGIFMLCGASHRQRESWENSFSPSPSGTRSRRISWQPTLCWEVP